MIKKNKSAKTPSLAMLAVGGLLYATVIHRTQLKSKNRQKSTTKHLPTKRVETKNCSKKYSYSIAYRARHAKSSAARRK